jgi:BirA family biotin operon repressor/biotin-[acetyl-CoA-carboxylase] ligase
VLVTEHQTAGKGRLDRTWETPDRAALTFSVLLRPRLDPADWPWLPLLTGVAVVEALAEHGVTAALKWPNDVLLPGDGDRKVAGLLAERVDTPDGPAAVLGVGLNVTTTAEELPVATATSLAVAGHDVDRTGLLVSLLDRLRERYAGLAAGGRARLARDYAAVCTTIGRPVAVQQPGGGTLRGRAVGLDDHGGLVVEGGEGRTVVSAGDVVHVRPEG